MRDAKQVEKYLEKQDQFSVRYYKKICQSAIKEAFNFHPEWKKIKSRKDISRVLSYIRKYYSPFKEVEHLSRLAEVIWDFTIHNLKMDLRASLA